MTAGTVESRAQILRHRNSIDFRKGNRPARAVSPAPRGEAAYAGPLRLEGCAPARSGQPHWTGLINATSFPSATDSGVPLLGNPRSGALVSTRAALPGLLGSARGERMSDPSELEAGAP